MFNIFSTFFIIKNQTEYIVVFNNYSHLHPQKQNNIESKPTDHPQSKKLQVLITSDGYEHPKQSTTVQIVYCREAKRISGEHAKKRKNQEEDQAWSPSGPSGPSCTIILIFRVTDGVVATCFWGIRCIRVLFQLHITAQQAIKLGESDVSLEKRKKNKNKKNKRKKKRRWRVEKPVIFLQ